MHMKKQKIVRSKEKESNRSSVLDYCGLYTRNEFIDNKKKAKRQEK